MRRGVARLLGVSTLLLLAGSAQAQQHEPSGEPAASKNHLADRVLDAQGLSELSLEKLLDQPVTTASGKAEERSLAAANVTTITREQIERRGYRSLAEILRQVPGLYLTYDYVGYSVGVREVTPGFRGGTRIVKVMIDGMPISFRPDLDASIGPEFIPVEAILRVEVAKGPLSALYGANAFLATVNVITREPEENGVEVAQRYMVTNGNSGAGTSAVATVAGINTSLLLAASMDSIDRSGMQTRSTYAGQRRSVDPILQSVIGIRPDGVHLASVDDMAKPLSAFGRLDYHHDKFGDFRLSGGYQELDSNTEFGLNSLMTHRSRVNIANQWSALSWQRRGRSLSARASLGLSSGAPKSDYQLFVTGQSNSSFRPNFDYRALNGLAELSYDFGHWLQGDLGFDTEITRETVLYYTERYYISNDFVKPFEERDVITTGSDLHENYRQLGTYLQLRSSPFKHLPDLRFTGSGRLDWITFGDITHPTQSSFRGAVAYRFDPRVTARLIGGRAFQTPSGTLLFAHAGFGNEANLIGSEGTVKLKPQTVNSAEFVLNAQVSDFLSLEASVYYQDLNDAIRFLQPVKSLIHSLNGGKVETFGGELIANLQFGPIRPYAAVSASRQLSAELPRVLRNINEFTASPSMYPRLFGYVGFDVELLRARLFANAEFRWAGERGASQSNFNTNDDTVYTLPAYHTLDVTLSTGGLPLIHRNAPTKILVSARNLLGADYMEPGFSGVDIPQLPTSLLFQVRQAM